MKKMLIAEDDQFLATIYQNKFQSEGFQVVIANDGVAAIVQLKKMTFDILLLDLMLPGLDGVEVLKFVRAQEQLKSLPVLVLSNTKVGDVMHAAREAGANKCLTKVGSTPETLSDEVNALLRPKKEAGPINLSLSGSHVKSAEPPPQVVAPPSPSILKRITTSCLSWTRSDAPIPKEEEIAANRAQGELIRETIGQMPQRMGEVRELLDRVIKCDTASRPVCILELYNAIRSMAGRASFGGFTSVAQLSGALEALLQDLHLKPEHVNSSTLRTLTQGVDLLALLFERSTQELDEFISSPLILVLDDESISRETVCIALEKVHLRAVAMEDSGLALKLLEQNRFDLVFLDVDMPGMNGFEVCKQMRASHHNTNTPVVYVSGLNDFEVRTQSALSGGNDCIAKPVVLIELAVKALIHLLRGRLAPV